jgi:hypothetical protein
LGFVSIHLLVVFGGYYLYRLVVIFRWGWVMFFDDLIDIIEKHGIRGSIGGCDVLGRVSDVPGFVSLLGHYTVPDGWGGYVDFVGEFPDPIGLILGGGVEFSVDFLSVDGVDYIFYGDDMMTRRLHAEMVRR